MQKTAVGVMLAGFVLAFFSLNFFGIDILIDSVGFLLVFNGARALAAWQAPFKPASACALALVAICALQLFFSTGAAAPLLHILRGAALAALFGFFAAGFGRLLDAARRTRLGTASRIVFLTAALGSLQAAALPLLAPALSPLSGIIAMASQIFVLFLLFFACILPDSLLY